MRRSLLLSFLVILAAAGCRSQAPSSPSPTVTVTPATFTCPSGYTCGFIPNRATCTSATSCPTPSSGGPYTALASAATAIQTPTFTDTAPPPGEIVAYSIEIVYLTGPGLTAPVTGLPGAASAALTIAEYPPTPGAPAVITTAALAPPVLPDAAPQPQVASNLVPTAGRPQVRVNYHLHD